MFVDTGTAIGKRRDLVFQTVDIPELGRRGVRGRELMSTRMQRKRDGGRPPSLEFGEALTQNL